MKEALIIFVRKPDLGKVKTRIAAHAGNEAALSIYNKLLQHTFEITFPTDYDKYVFYADAIVEHDLWSNGYHKALQANTDLGNRMQIAFTHLFEKGYKRICIVGSDCYELSTEIIRGAFRSLDTHEIVIGPARDGGYYLLAMKDGVKTIFEGIDWSTEKVLAQTIQRLSPIHI